MTTPPPQDPFAPQEPYAPSAQPSYGPPPGYGPPPAYGPPPQPQGWGPPPGPPGWGPPGYAAPQTESKAIIALVCAIGSYFVFPVIPAVVALVLAGQAKRDIAASGGRLTGEGLVTAAKVVAWINLVLAVLAVLAVVLVVAVFAGGAGEFSDTTGVYSG